MEIQHRPAAIISKGALLLSSAIVIAMPAAAQQPAGSNGQSALEEIVVTGTRLGQAGFTAPMPVTTLGADALRSQGSTNVGEALNTLPAFRPQTTPSTAAIFPGNIGAQTADLRGLGAARTLVLVDGRRFVPSTIPGGSLGSAFTVDLNMIPVSLIQRVEVVTGGASAAYGSDAVAGVVNILLDKKLEGVRTNFQYGQTEEDDAHEYTASIAAGSSFAGGRGHIVAGFDYVKNNGTGDCYTRSWCAESYGVVTNGQRGNGLPAQIVLPNIRTATSSYGGLITSGVLSGQSFQPDGSLVPYARGTYYGAGLFQSGGGDGTTTTPFYVNYPIYAPTERYTGLVHGEIELSDKLTAFGEFSYGRITGTSIGAQTRDTAISITRDNPFLPQAVVDAMTDAGQNSFTFGRIGQDLGPSYNYSRRSTMRIVVGFDGKLGDNWSWNAYYQHGWTDYRQRQTNQRINDNFTRAVDAVDEGQFLTGVPNGNIVCRSTLTDPTNPLVAGCQPLNLFGENNFSAAAKAYSYGTAWTNIDIYQDVAAASIQGDLVELWAGPLSVAAGLEYRRDDVSGRSDPLSVAGRFYTAVDGSIKGAVTVKEGFVEAGLPLLRDVPFVHSLELNGAVRLTDYSTSGRVTTWKVGAVWEPVEWLRLRATRSRDIRAPNAFDLYQPLAGTYQFLLDPRYPQQGSTLTLAYSGGNPNLDPEKADTLTIGAVVAPKSGLLSGLRLAVDYYDIKLDGAIAALGGQTVLDRWAAGATDLCALIQRDSTGQLISVTNYVQNVSELITRGWDIEGSYQFNLADLASKLDGQVSLRVLATKVNDLITVDSNGSVDRAGMNGSPISQLSGLPKWTVNTTLTFDKGPFSISGQLRYISSGVYNATLIGPGQDGYDPSAANSISDNSVGAYALVNLFGHYDIIDRPGLQVQLYAAINNLFDRDPPNDLPSSFGVTNNVLYDVLGRSYRGGVRVNF